jgi:hypothetical protein
LKLSVTTSTYRFEATVVIERDGVEISRAFSRHVVAPDADVSGESAEVQAICAVVHTDEVKAAYAAMLEAQGV